MVVIFTLFHRILAPPMVPSARSAPRSKKQRPSDDRSNGAASLFRRAYARPVDYVPARAARVLWRNRAWDQRVTEGDRGVGGGGGLGSGGRTEFTRHRISTEKLVEF